MDKNKQYKIALLLYTAGLDYDDRIRKEMKSISELFPNVSFKIFAVEPNNREEEGVTSYGVPYRIPYLKSRDKYASNTHTKEKAWDFYRTVKGDLKHFDAIWCADIETFFFTLLLQGKPMLWDMHELPGQLMKKWWTKALFRYSERKLRVLVHANKPRFEYLQSIGMVKHPEKHYILRNYPDFNEIDSEYDEMYHRFEEWLGDDKCVYLQGITNRDRADIESVGAVLDVEGLKAVVIGRTRTILRSILEEKYGKEQVEQRLFFTGQIKQLKTPQYIRKCEMSLVFYTKTGMNNWYCEPNRLFQNINNGNPVVVGSNPPLKEIVENYRVGVCAGTDGSDQTKIAAAIRKVLDDIDTYKKALAECSDKWIWSYQKETIATFMEKFLN